MGWSIDPPPSLNPSPHLGIQARVWSIPCVFTKHDDSRNGIGRLLHVLQSVVDQRNGANQLAHLQLGPGFGRWWMRISILV